VRGYIFPSAPDRNLLARITDPPPAPLRKPAQLIDDLFLQTLGRAHARPPSGNWRSKPRWKICCGFCSIIRSFSMSIDRRFFLRHGAAATLAALHGASPRLVSAPRTGKADSMILLWMAGGMAQTETFDPKRYTPFSTGLASDRVLSTFKPIPTAVDGVQISEGLEKIAGVLDRGVADPVASRR
jgi:hypothetical protein